MKNVGIAQTNCDYGRWSTGTPVARLAGLHLITTHDVESLRSALARGHLPPDFEAKLVMLLEGDNLLHQFVEKNCRLFIAMLAAAGDNSFGDTGPMARERLLRVLAYVRKDDDAIPDYQPGGFRDDQQEVRAVIIDLGPLLGGFKAWRLRHQVPGFWRSSYGTEAAAA